jgi:hypothetical protein
MTTVFVATPWEKGVIPIVLYFMRATDSFILKSLQSPELEIANKHKQGTKLSPINMFL